MNANLDFLIATASGAGLEDGVVIRFYQLN